MALLSSATIVGCSSMTCSAMSQSRRPGGPAMMMGGEWGSSQMNGDGRVQLRRAVNLVRVAAVPVRPQIRMMGNKNDGKGIFAPLVVLVRNVIGAKKFNPLRGKGIALHSQVITEFCKLIGADAKQRQGLIRLAKKNGEKLGFLA